MTEAISSEWTKLASLRSAWYTAGLAVVLGVGFGALVSQGSGRRYAEMPAAERATFDPTNVSLYGCFLLTQLAVGTLGVLVMTSEYATGTIGPSLAAVPRRGRLLAAKTVVFAAVSLVLGQVAAFGAFLAGQAALAGEGAPHAALADPDVTRAVVGAGLWLVLVGLLGMALGVVLRATAGAIATLVGVTLLVPLFSTMLPGPVGKYWPTLAGLRITAVVPDPAALSPWQGFGLLCATVAAVLAVAYAVFRTRDAS